MVERPFRTPSGGAFTVPGPSAPDGAPVPSQVKQIFSKGLPGLVAEYPVYCHTARQAHTNASTITPTQTPFTADFDSLRPKKNMQAAPNAGNSGISQM